jgi:hypothetical protein
MPEDSVFADITIKVERNFLTKAPYWLILEPDQNMSCDINKMGYGITRPFFTFQEALECFQNNRRSFRRNAGIYKASGHHTTAFRSAWEKALEQHTSEEGEVK